MEGMWIGKEDEEKKDGESRYSRDRKRERKKAGIGRGKKMAGIERGKGRMQG